MKTAIVGARRKRNGIGHYIANYFKENGAEVVAVMGSSAESAVVASAALHQFGITATPYEDFGRMVAAEDIDTVVLASPAATHRPYLYRALEAGKHVFCEKPFITGSTADPGTVLKDIFSQAERNNLVIAMNSQWPFALPFYEALCGAVEPHFLSSFFIHLSPPCSGKEMLVESLPHVLSILYCKCGRGTIGNPTITKGRGEMTISFDYHFNSTTCSVQVHLKQQLQPPRDFSFGFNGEIVKRSIRGTAYEIFFNHAGRSLKIVDPLYLSIKDFTTALASTRQPLIGKDHITHTTLMLSRVLASCTVL